MIGKSSPRAVMYLQLPVVHRRVKTETCTCRHHGRRAADSIMGKGQHRLPLRRIGQGDCIDAGPTANAGKRPAKLMEDLSCVHCLVTAVAAEQWRWTKIRWSWPLRQVIAMAECRRGKRRTPT